MKKSIDFMKTMGICFVGILILLIAQGVSSIFYALNLSGFQYILQGVTCVLCVYILIKLFVEKIVQKKLSDSYITNIKMKKEWVILAISLPVMVIVLTILFVPGDFFFTPTSFAEKFAAGMYAFFTVGLAAGIVEEMVFRGLMLSTVTERYGKWIGIVVPSILFGALHLLNGNLNFASFMLLILGGSLVGILFSLLADANKTIWSSAIVHSSWNFLIIGGLCDFGWDPNESAIANYIFTTDDIFLTGGQFGIEVSIFSIICYLISIIYLMKKRPKKSQE